MTRVGSTEGFARAAQLMAGLEADIANAQSRISGGKRLLSPADAPLDAAQVSLLARTQAEIAATRRGIGAESARLSQSDAALATAVDRLQRAREVALGAGTATANASDRAAAAAELAELATEVRALAGGTEADPVAAARAALLLPDPTERGRALAAALDGLDAADGSLAVRRTMVGANLARLEADDRRLADDALTLAARRRGLEDTDVAAAATELQALRLRLDAVRAMLARDGARSLFDLIR